MDGQSEKLRILLVEDDSEYAGLVVESLSNHSSVPTSVTRSPLADDAVARLRAETFDAVLLDLDLPDSQGLNTLRRLAPYAASSPMIILTSRHDERLRSAVLHEGAEEYLVKDDADLQALPATIRHAIGRQAYREVLRVLESREGHERFRVLADKIKEALLIVDMPNGKAVYLSRMWEAIWGRRVDEAYADPNVWFQAIHPDDRATVVGGMAALPSGGPTSCTFRLWRPDGMMRWVRGRGFPILDDQQRLRRLVALVEDITDVRHTEEQLRQAQKMEAIGRLAGGVAHDFNNLLVVIEGYAKMIAQDLGPSHPSQEGLEEILAAARSAANLTGQLLAFSRKQILQPQILDLNSLLRRVERMLRRVLGEDITLAMRLSESLSRVSADPGQIEQVIMNLSVNARDAMPHGGRLTIETADVDLDEAYVTQHPGAARGKHVLIAVSDNGVGMDEATKQRVFEPFFTTKLAGQGTGLGLATVYGIVKQSQGSIWVYSERGTGSTFKIYLPAVGDPSLPVSPRRVAVDSLTGTETVLLVEDQIEVRRLVAKTLHRHGYKILAAADGDEATALARAHQGDIHLVLTDVVLPGMSGREVARQITAERGGVRVLYMSGYTDDAIVNHGVLESGLAFVQKPFTVETLLRKVREVLSADLPPKP